MKKLFTIITILFLFNIYNLAFAKVMYHQDDFTFGFANNTKFPTLTVVSSTSLPFVDFNTYLLMPLLYGYPYTVEDKISGTRLCSVEASSMIDKGSTPNIAIHSFQPNSISCNLLHNDNGPYLEISSVLK